MKKGAFWMVLIAAFVFSQNDAACHVIKLDTGWHHVGNADPHEPKRCVARRAPNKVRL